jgi:hypothetical protein
MSFEIPELIEEGLPVIEDGAEVVIPWERVEEFRKYLAEKKDFIGLGKEEPYPGSKEGSIYKLNTNALEVVTDLLKDSFGDEYNVTELIEKKKQFNPSIYDDVGLHDEAEACFKALEYLEQDL